MKSIVLPCWVKVQCRSVYLLNWLHWKSNSERAFVLSPPWGVCLGLVTKNWVDWKWEFAEIDEDSSADNASWFNPKESKRRRSVMIHHEAKTENCVWPLFIRQAEQRIFFTREKLKHGKTTEWEKEKLELVNFTTKSPCVRICFIAHTISRWSGITCWVLSLWWVSINLLLFLSREARGLRRGWDGNGEIWDVDQ